VPAAFQTYIRGVNAINAASLHFWEAQAASLPHSGALPNAFLREAQWQSADCSFADRQAADLCRLAACAPQDQNRWVARLCHAETVG
jgi:hypothetical protein